MKYRQPSALAMAVGLAFPALAAAQSNEQLLKELQALKDRVTQLEAALKSKDAAKPAAGQWGMTPEQAAEMSRLSVKTEAIEDNLKMWGFKGLTVTGYIEPVFIYNHRQHRAGFQFLNDQADGYFYDTSYMGTAAIGFAKETEGGSLWKLTLAPNRGIGALIGAGIVQEASVSVPLTGETKLLAGQIPDWSGYEYQQPTLNPFTTHNLLYDFTLPTAYTGVGIETPVGGLTLKAMVANVNATIRSEREKSPVLVYRGDYELSEFAGVGFAGLHGKSPNFNGEGRNTFAHLFEIDGYYNRGDLTLQGQFGIGRQKKAAITPDANGNFRDASWWGVSGLAGYNLAPRLQGLVRADYINNKKNGGGLFGYNGYSGFDDNGDLAFGNDDRNGLGPDLAGDLDRGANRYALSFGLKYLFNENTTLKAEYRLDGADRAVFIDVKDGSYGKRNHLFGASLVVFF